MAERETSTNSLLAPPEMLIKLNLPFISFGMTCENYWGFQTHGVAARHWWHDCNWRLSIFIHSGWFDMRHLGGWSGFDTRCSGLAEGSLDRNLPPSGLTTSFFWRLSGLVTSSTGVFTTPPENAARRCLVLAASAPNLGNYCLGFFAISCWYC